MQCAQRNPRRAHSRLCIPQNKEISSSASVLAKLGQNLKLLLMKDSLTWGHLVQCLFLPLNFRLTGHSNTHIMRPVTRFPRATWDTEPYLTFWAQSISEVRCARTGAGLVLTKHGFSDSAAKSRPLCHACFFSLLWRSLCILVGFIPFGIRCLDHWRVCIIQLVLLRRKTLNMVFLSTIF